MGYYNPYYMSRPSRRAPQPRPNADPEVVQAYREEHPDECAWIETAARRDNDFACSLLASLNRYGSLTERQIGAVRNNIVRDAQRTADQQRRAENAPTVSIDAIETAFATAKAAGVGRPTLRLDVFKFSPAGAQSVNPGAVYVKDAEDQTYLGKVMHGKFVRSRECNDDAEHRILAVCADPREAAIAYGKRFGVCSVCGRTLTDPVSVEAGIGPVCKDRYGW